MTLDEALKIVYKEVEYAYDDKIKDKSNRNWNEDYEHYHNYRHAMTTIEKSLKALEIIKYNHIDINEFEDSCDADDYNQRYNSPLWDITQEEFNLLKEVLE